MNWQTKPRWRAHPAEWFSGAAEEADRLVHAHPLASAGTLFALGLVVGCAAGLLLTSVAPQRPPRRAQRLREIAPSWTRPRGARQRAWFS